MIERDVDTWLRYISESEITMKSENRRPILEYFFQVMKNIKSKNIVSA